MPYTPPVYPTSIPSTTDLPDRTDDVDTIYAARYNELKKELIAALTELGTLPKGSFGSVKLRIEDIESDIAGLSTPYAKSIIPLSVAPDATWNGYGLFDDNTIAHVCKVTFPIGIQVNHISFECIDYVGDPTNIKIGLYSLDGQTKHFEWLSAEVSAAGVVKTTLGAQATIPAGTYYLVMINEDTVLGFQPSIMLRGSDLLANEVPDETPHAGVLFDMTAGTLPATFDPLSDITPMDGDGMILRFDN